MDKTQLRKTNPRIAGNELVLVCFWLLYYSLLCILLYCNLVCRTLTDSQSGSLRIKSVLVRPLIFLYSLTVFAFRLVNGALLELVCKPLVLLVFSVIY